MLKKEDNELLTRVAGDTPMASLMKHYWVPACRSEALAAGGDPKRVTLFGRNYVAFRADDGRVGFIKEGCPHRGTSMLLARNEDCALTCIFHGWKVDVSGKVVDCPSEPNRYEFGKKIKVGHYPVREAGSAVWVYVGEGAPPPFPDFEFSQLPQDQIESYVNYTTCNWLQGLEGTLDSAHLGILHKSHLEKRKKLDLSPEELLIRNVEESSAPYYEIERQDYGMTSAAIRDLPNGDKYVRKYEFVFPFFTFIPSPRTASRVMICAIPLDDVRTAQWYFFYDLNKKFTMEDRGMSIDVDKNDAYKPPGTYENNWYQIRSEMKQHWTGMVDVPLTYEDFVAQESMGPIVDRSEEQLGTSDVFIIQVRLQLLNAVKAYMEDGKPFGLDKNVDYRRIQSNAEVISKEEDWRNSGKKQYS